jgi:phosphoribosylpyrophosphate synthetase
MSPENRPGIPIEQPIDCFHNSDLSRRDIALRFSGQEKTELSQIIQQSWKELHEDEEYRNAEILSLTSENYTWGKYPDGEAWALATPLGQQRTGTKQYSHLYASVNLETGDDVLATQTILQHLKNPNTILGTAYFPYERGDRPDIRPDGKQELLLLRTLITNLKYEKVKGIFHIRPHSPAFAWFCLQAGIAPLSLSALPLLIQEADQQGFLKGDIITANSDEGAQASRESLTGFIPNVGSINGNKKKEGGKTIVTYSDDDFLKAQDKTIIFTEDIISTGSTMVSSILQLLNRGQAKKVIILAEYPIFAGNALERLGYDPRIQIITTDGRTPIAHISDSNNIFVVPVKDKIPNVMELDRRGVDFWSPNGKQELLNLGLCLTP